MRHSVNAEEDLTYMGSRILLLIVHLANLILISKGTAFTKKGSRGDIEDRIAFKSAASLKVCKDYLERFDVATAGDFCSEEFTCVLYAQKTEDLREDARCTYFWRPPVTTTTASTTAAYEAVTTERNATTTNSITEPTASTAKPTTSTTERNYLTEAVHSKSDTTPSTIVSAAVTKEPNATLTASTAEPKNMTVPGIYPNSGASEAVTTEPNETANASTAEPATSSAKSNYSKYTAIHRKSGYETFTTEPAATTTTPPTITTTPTEISTTAATTTPTAIASTASTTTPAASTTTPAATTATPTAVPNLSIAAYSSLMSTDTEVIIAVTVGTLAVASLITFFSALEYGRRKRRRARFDVVAIPADQN
ncbi:uncharacterized protein [Haliotis asinina]|uniref:uncharacterized protein isoform X2 n=1 Tax=Haliotis asinina TaxID=109174 RepID=UPI003531B0A2